MTLDAYRNQDLPIEEILQALQAVAQHGSEHIVSGDVHSAKPVADSPGAPGTVGATLLDVDPGIARVDLLLELIEADERLAGWFEYSTDLFEAATMARMAEHLQTLLEAIVANPEERISRLPLLPGRTQAGAHRLERDHRPVSVHLGTFSERFARQARAHAGRHRGVRRGGFDSAIGSSRVGARLSPTGS